MNTHRNRKKLFIAGIFVLLLMLAFGSMITFAKNGARTSYTLTIVKKLDLSKFPDGTDLDALSYNFNVTGATSANPPCLLTNRLPSTTSKKQREATWRKVPPRLIWEVPPR